MRSAVHYEYGGPDTVRLVEVEKPVPNADQVLVRVHAAGVNRADLDGLYPRWQFTRLFLGVRRPRPRFQALGIDLAGAVEAVGDEVTRFKVGDRVFGELAGAGGFGSEGAFADYVCTREKSLQPTPAGLSDESAAALPHSGVLALQALRRPGGRTVGAGERLMVIGASGNVGPYAVQIGKTLGAHVTGVARGSKLDFVRSLGADEVIDYETTDYTRPTDPFDWVVDVDAHHSLLHMRRTLKPDGVYVALGGSFAWMLSTIPQAIALRLGSSKRMGLMLWWKPFHRPDVEKLLELVAAGLVTPQIDRRFPLDQVADALKWVDDGHARGKVLVIP